MSRINVSLSPGMITDPDTVLVVRLRSPRQAEEVRLTVNEMDTWQYRGQEMVEWSDAADDPIAVFHGSINNRRFQVDRVEQAEAPDNAPILKVKFHGNDTVHELRIPDASLAEEGGELELGVEASGIIRRRGRLIPAEGRTRWPVFRRNYGPNGAQQRPIVSFVAGNDGFHRAARQFWNRRADAMSRRPNVEKILEFLRSQDNLGDHGDGHWGEINIISHANSWQWMMRLFHGRPVVRHIDSTALNEHGNNARLQAPGDDMMDNQTKVIIRGCVIGRNQRLLNQIQTLFGGNAHVYAPKYIQAYEFFQRGRLRVAREYFKEFFFFYVPGRRSPNRATCLRTLREKYTEAGIDDEEWGRLLRGTGDRSRKDKTERFRYNLNFGALVPPTSRAELLAALSDNWPGGDATYDTTVEDWSWTTRRQVSGPRGNRRYRVLFTGQRRRVEVRRPLKDADGYYIVPNINEQEHYGRSPEWGWE